jgi:23S rRNA (adenine1618-N6)-methyltransferase
MNSLLICIFIAHNTPMHPNNKHSGSYNFKKLCSIHPTLKKYVKDNGYGKESIDFSNSDAVFQLNKALLKLHYGIVAWDIPSGYLSPPIPSRADYLYYLNDLLSEISITTKIHVLDIGVGANAIYCLLGAQLFGWHMVGTDIDTVAVKAATMNVANTPDLSELIDIRHQPNNAHIFEGIIKPNEFYHATICNPPFYTSEKDSNAATLRKLKKINPEKSVLALERNFEGRPNELWCNGGEALFIKRMIKQSVQFKDQVGWFTTLVSKKETLENTYKLLNKVKAYHKTLQLEHGNKITRVVAWHFK